MQDLVDKLNSEFVRLGITKFSAEEIVELLQDGEDISWISDQLSIKPDHPMAPLLQQLSESIIPLDSIEELSESSTQDEVENTSEEDSLDLSD